MIRDTGGMDAVTIRPGRRGDLADLLTIYNHYVEHSDATLDVLPATMIEREAWLSAYGALGRHQLLVADDGGDVLGYATSSPYRGHPAFDQTVEVSVYVRADALGRGLGGRLYDALLARLADTDVHSVVAAVALPNDGSIALHRSRGFTEIGTFTQYAIKNGRRISSMWFERVITNEQAPRA
jgi:phosphinothricin acetyltransferase